MNTEETFCCILKLLLSGFVNVNLYFKRMRLEVKAESQSTYSHTVSRIQRSRQILRKCGEVKSPGKRATN